jgi:hypothetical protein
MGQNKQNKTKQNKTKQNKTKQNKTKQNKTKQNKHGAKVTIIKTPGTNLAPKPGLLPQFVWSQIMLADFPKDSPRGEDSPGVCPIVAAL